MRELILNLKRSEDPRQREAAKISKIFEKEIFLHKRFRPPLSCISKAVKKYKNKISIFAQPIDIDIQTDITQTYEPLWSQ